MNPIPAIVSWLSGCFLGLQLLTARPGGLDTTYGWLLLGLSGMLALPLALAWPDRRARTACLCAMFLLLGSGRALLTHPPATAADLAYYNNISPTAERRVTIVGEVSGEPVLRDRSQRLRIYAESIHILPGEPPIDVRGQLLVMLPRYPEYSIGERLSLDGSLTPPPEVDDFDYPAYLARQGVYSYMLFPRVSTRERTPEIGLGALVVGVRQQARASITSALPEPHAALATGIVLGDRSALPPNVTEAFNRSGTSHLLAISGQNITLLVGVVWLAFSGPGRRRRLPVPAMLLLLLILLSYTLFTGATASVVRAAIMGGVLLLAPPFRRRYDPTAAVALSAFLMTLPDPNVIADAGFQLSFAAMIGITLLAPRIQDFFGRAKLHPVLAVPLATSLAAQAATVPIVVLLTGQIALVSPLATMLMDPALLPVMVLGICIVIAGGIFSPLAAVLGWLAWFPGSWMLFMVQWWGSLTWAAIHAERVSLWSVLCYYFALGSALWLSAAARRLSWVRRILGTPRLAAATGLVASLWLGVVAALFAG